MKVVLILSMLVLSLSFGEVSARCIPIYDQTPTQEQVNAYNQGVDVGVSGGYALSRQVGCEPERESSGWGFLLFPAVVGFIIYIGSRR